MKTVSKLSKQFDLSRTTLLYYEKEGLLLPALRSENGYRWYGENEELRLRAIINYRSFGISIAEIKLLLAKTDDNRQQQVLLQQFDNLDNEIKKLRRQQLAIVNYLEMPDLVTGQDMTKQKWTSIMRNSGMSDQDMMNWHKEFEKLQPEGHQQFLESLQIQKKEIQKIRLLSGKVD